MSAELKLKAANGGSLSLACDDSLTTDEVVVVPKDMQTAIITCSINSGTITDNYSDNIHSVGTYSAGVGNIEFSFDTAMTTTNYVVSPIATTGGGDYSFCSVIVKEKTVNGFKLHFRGIQSGPSFNPPSTLSLVDVIVFGGK